MGFQAQLEPIPLSLAIIIIIIGSVWIKRAEGFINCEEQIISTVCVQFPNFCAIRFTKKLYN